MARGCGIVRVWITGEIEHDGVGPIIQDIVEAPRDSDIEVHLVGCPGGCLWSGFAIFDALRAHPGTVTTIASGLVSSMGVVLLQAGDRRLIRQHGALMTHIGSTTVQGDHRDAIAQLEFEHRVCRKMLEDVCGMKLAGDRYFTPAEALDAGLVDEIV